MKIKKISNIFAMLFILVFTSCGDLFMRKQEAENTFEQFQQCKMDTSALSEILDRKIKPELKCLEKNLNLFINVVKTDRPGNLSLKELKLYIDKHIKDIDADVIKAIDVLFELNSVLLGDDKNYISRKNVKNLIDIFVEFNDVMVDNQVVQYFKDQENLNFKEYKFRRSQIFEAINYISKKLIKLPTPHENMAKINIINTINTFKKESNAQTISKISRFMFFKRVFLGGEKDFLTAMEAKNLVAVLSDLTTVVYDLTHLGSIDDLVENEEEFLITLTNIFSLVDNSLTIQNDSEVLMSYKEFTSLVNSFAPDYSEYLKYKDNILKTKKIILGNDSEDFTFSDIKNLISNTILANLKKGLFFYRTYKLNQQVLEQGEELAFEIPSYVLEGKGESSYLKEFNRILKSYRFIKGKNIAPFYQKFVKRDPLGIFAISFVEEIVLKVIKYYGVVEKSSNAGHHLTHENIKRMLEDFKAVLVGEGIIHPKRLNKTAGTIFLMSGIFQSNSDGDYFIERDELVQFVSTIKTSLDIQNVLLKNLNQYCDVDVKNRFSAECFRRSFLTLLKESKKDSNELSVYFPKLIEFMNKLDSDNQVKYLKSIEKFSRNCMEYNGKEIKMYPEDIFLIFGGLQSVEQTMIRFDEDENNLLELSEIDNAFAVYQNSVLEMLPDQQLRRFAKTFFLYMIRHKKIPEKDLSFYSFLATSKKYTPADRFTLAAIIQTLSELSKEQPYPCHTLVD